MGLSELEPHFFHACTSTSRNGACDRSTIYSDRAKALDENEEDLVSRRYLSFEVRAEDDCRTERIYLHFYNRTGQIS